ncbi:MAG: site-2 protease family protein [Candidatus Thermoplasmatota archaeon]|nr:site-2 protease family protein [Candidatus Thermoplasmatota archaeon]
MDSVWIPVIISIVIAWFVLIYVLNRKKILEKYHMSLSGPILLVHTVKGRKTIEKIANKKIWKYFGNFAIALCVAVMIFMVALLCWSAAIATQIPAKAAPSPRMLIGLPVINPIIPLWYGLLGLIIAMVVHEFSHGIFAAFAKIKIKSLGVLFLILPLGAFVEPDEDELKNIKKIKRSRVYAAGPAMNMVVALICAMIFSWSFMGSVTPLHDGIIVTSVESGSPAESIVSPGALITSFNDIEMKNREDFSNAIKLTKANQKVNITIYYNEKFTSANVTLGNRYDYTKNEEDKGTGYFGINYDGADVLPNVLSHPFSSAGSFKEVLGNSITYIALPLFGLSPFHSPITDAYTVHGFWSFLPADAFWILANIFYWVFWINLMLGLTNVLPAVPLDGGYIFKDGADSFLHRFIKEDKKREKRVNGLCYTVALFILFLILWQIIGPRLSLIGL